MDYTRAQTLEKCRQALKEPKLFYRADCVRYAGRCTDTKEYYTEIVAQFLLAHLEEYIAGIPQITRDGSYRTDTHDGVFNPNSRRKEEILAMQLFNCCKSGESFSHIGRILDYQTPLKSRQSDDAGKVDLLAYDGKCLRILELKAEGNKNETMLRCVLEGFTYLRTADRKKLPENFGLPAGTPVYASPLVFAGSRFHQEYRENRPCLKQLMAKLKSVPFFLKETDGKYIVLSEVEANED